MDENGKQDGVLCVSAEQAWLFLFVALQASEDFFTFEQENITVSVMAVSNTIPLVKGKRQTLLIPANLNNTWEVVSTGLQNFHNTNTP